VVDISDNGSGIPEEFRRNIFDKFVRAGRMEHSSIATRGLGLGLNISHKIVEKMNGSLELAHGPLPGACFRITLPLRREAVAVAE